VRGKKKFKKKNQTKKPKGLTMDQSIQIQNTLSLRKHDSTLMPSCSATAAVQSKISGNVFACRRFYSAL